LLIAFFHFVIHAFHFLDKSDFVLKNMFAIQ
jgi:hypothetical protein